MAIQFKQISSYDNYILANITLGLLQENGINCHLKDEYIVTIDPFLNPAVGGIKLMVEASEEERAQDLIQLAEKEYLKQVACPVCNAYSLVMEKYSNKPLDFWGRLKNMALFGQTEINKSRYRCSQCQTLFSTMPTI